MDIGARLAISYYKEIATISEQHNIFVVQHLHSHRIYVKKILDVYNKKIYDFLHSNYIPHTPKIYEVCEENNKLIVIEEYISGNTIEQHLDNGRIFSVSETHSIISQLCIILRELHSCTPAIIHRDVKPSNIILSPSGDVYLLDFNAAKFQSAEKGKDTSLLGTKGFAAPEQYGFGVSTAQTDIYAVGILIKTIIAPSGIGNDNNNFFSLMIAKCTKMEPKDRYRSIDSLLRALDNSIEAKTTKNRILPYWTTYFPPGFRSLSPIKMIPSAIAYYSIIRICVTTKFSDSTVIEQYLLRYFCLIAILAVIFCTANYRNVHSVFPFCKSENILIRILGILLLDTIVFSVLMFILCMLLIWF